LKSSRRTSTEAVTERTGGTGADRLRWAGLALLGLLIVGGPLLQGLYTEPPQFLAVWLGTILLGIVAALSVSERRPFVLTAARGAALALWLAYALAAFLAAAVPRDAVQEVIKHGVLFGAFVAASELVRSGLARPDRPSGTGLTPEHDVSSVLMGLLWAGAVLTALAGLLGAAGLVSLPVEVVRGGRLAGLFGYANASGALFGAAFLLGTAVRRDGRGRAAALGALVTVGQVLLLAALLLTMSRGAWLAVIAGGAVAVWLWPAGRRVSLIGYIVLTGAVALPVGFYLTRVLGQPLQGGAALGVAVAAALLVDWVAGRFEKTSPRKQAAITAGVGVAMVALTVALALGNVLPPNLVTRLTSYGLSESSVWQRLDWMQDAAEIMADHPLLGVGGGGWASRYLQYQEYAYYSATVHSDYLEIGVATGFLGLAALLTLFGSSLYALGRQWRQWCETQTRDGEAGGHLRLAVLGGAAVMVMGHCAIDFDFAYAAVAVFLWVILGILDGHRAVSREDAQGSARPGRASAGRHRRPGRRSGGGSGSPWGAWAVILALALATSVLAGSLFAAAQAAARAEELEGPKNAGHRWKALAKACRLDPWSRPLRLRLVNALLQLLHITKDPDYAVEAYREIVAATELDPYHPDSHTALAQFLYSFGYIEEAVREVEKALELQPAEPTRYANLAQIYQLAGEHFLKEGDAEKAMHYLELAVGMQDRYAARVAQQGPRVAQSVYALPPLLAPLAWHAGKAQALTGNWEEAFELLTAAYRESPCKRARETAAQARERRLDAALWLALVYERTGNLEKARTLMEEVQKSLPDADQRRLEILPLLGTAG